jgi:hypothetical protein
MCDLVIAIYSVNIGENVIVICNYKLHTFNKSNYQFKSLRLVTNMLQYNIFKWHALHTEYHKYGEVLFCSKQIVCIQNKE